MKTLCSIITGDLVNSESLTSEKVTRLIRTMGEDLEIHLHPFKVPLAQYRGDGLQLMCKIPEQGITMLMLIKAWMAWKSPELIGQAVGIRLSLGIGEGSLQSTLGSSGGPAFVLSGRGLDALKAPYTMSIALDKASDELEQQTLTQIVNLLDELCGHWKAAQGRTIFKLLQGYSYTQISQLTGVSKAAVGKSGKSAGWPWLEKTIPFCEQLIKQSL